MAHLKKPRDPTNEEERQRRRRVVVPVAAGVVLVAIPTVFAVFPSLTDWPTGARMTILSVWVAVAIVGTILTNIADDRLHRAIRADQQSAIVAEHRATLREQFNGLLQPAIGGIPEQYHLTVYAPSPDGQFLLPVFPAVVSLEDPSIFPIGAGAAGRAWQEAEGVLVIKGAAVSSPVHGLTKLQQERYAMFGVVAATVIRDAAGERIGVITAIGRDDDGFFDGLAGIKLMRNLATSVAWIIPEAVKWMWPRPGEVKR